MLLIFTLVFCYINIATAFIKDRGLSRVVPVFEFGCAAKAVGGSRRSVEGADSLHTTQRIRPIPNGWDFDLPYESAVEALRAYRIKHGDLVIPRRYRVPEEEPFPHEWHGLDLSRVYNMKWWSKNVSKRKERVQELNSLGFVWERLQPEWNLILEALITYKALHGDLLVPNSFIVPHGEKRWSKGTWKIPLGNCVYRIRSRHDFLKHDNAGSRREQLEGLGFVWDVRGYRFRLFYAALTHYARLNKCGAFSDGSAKSIQIPSEFVVPRSSQWPAELWRYPLGHKCTAVRQKELYVKSKPDHKLMLQSIGFHWNGNSDLGWLRVVHAAAIYSKINGRNLDVPSHFMVPSPPDTNCGTYLPDEWPWPEHLWGLPLGQRLKDVRLKGTYLKGDLGPKRRIQLDALGFVWKPKRGRRRTLSRPLHSN